LTIRAFTPPVRILEPRSGFDTVCIEFMKKAGGQRIKIGCSGNFDFWKLLNLNGGRDKTRTCDLLRVKHYGLIRFVEASGT